MGSTINQLKKELKKKKEGLIVGALAGFVISNYWLVNNPAILQSALSTQGVFEKFISNPGTVEVAKQKIVIIITLTFTLIGYVIDGLMDKK